MNRTRSSKARLAAALAAAGLSLIAATAPAEAATPVACPGTITVIPALETQVVRQHGHWTFISFDFTGFHSICLANGTTVTGTIEGHARQVIGPGSMTLRFDEVLSYGHSTLPFTGAASLHGTTWESSVQTAGHGTGHLAGISGHGSFYPTDDPAVFGDVIYYVYS